MIWRPERRDASGQRSSIAIVMRCYRHSVSRLSDVGEPATLQEQARKTQHEHQPGCLTL